MGQDCILSRQVTNLSYVLVAALAGLGSQKPGILKMPGFYFADCKRQVRRAAVRKPSGGAIAIIRKN